MEGNAMEENITKLQDYKNCKIIPPLTRRGY